MGVEQRRHGRGGLVGTNRHVTHLLEHQHRIVPRVIKKRFSHQIKGDRVMVRSTPDHSFRYYPQTLRLRILVIHGSALVGFDHDEDASLGGYGEGLAAEV